MPSPKTQPARGMRDFLPADVRKREYVIAVIKQVYERYGFEPLETPAVENIETLMGKYGEEGNQLIFKILKRGEHEKTGEADLALRYDLTVPLARVVAQYQNDLPKFFKRYQIQPVWRADRPARGRFREFYQCDVDVLGSQSMVVEAELIAAASDALVALGFKDFTIRLNHRQVLTGILDQAGVLREKHDDALIALDKMDKAGPEGVAREFRERGIVDESAVRLMRFFEGLAGAKHALDLVDLGEAADARAAYNGDALGRLVEFIGAHEIGASGVDDLRQILQFAKASGVDARIKLDPTLARGLAYYTGAIIEMNVADLAGSLGGGGRYDNLVGMFLGKDVPACGFSLGLERILVVMDEKGMFDEPMRRGDLKLDSADVMVTIWNEDSVAESTALASELRKNGLRVDLYPEPDKLAKQFKYASARGIPFVAIIGEEEKVKSEVAIKDMRSGEQRSFSRPALNSALDQLGLRVRTAELRRHWLDESIRPIRDSLTKVDNRITEIERARSAAHSELLTQAQTLVTAERQIEAETGRAYRNAFQRGRWGEISLRRVIELSGVEEYCDFSEDIVQPSVKVPMRPDAVLRLPGNRTIAIEAKSSFEALYLSLSAKDEESQREKLNEYVTTLRHQITALTQSPYLETVQPRPEFILLFLPGEFFFSAALEAYPNLVDESLTKGVVITTPTVLISLLKAISYGWREHKLAEEANELRELGKNFYYQVSTFTDQVIADRVS